MFGSSGPRPDLVGLDAVAFAQFLRLLVDADENVHRLRQRLHAEAQRRRHRFRLQFHEEFENRRRHFQRGAGDQLRVGRIVG